MRMLWTEIAEGREELHKKGDRIVLLSDFLRLFDEDHNPRDGLILQDVFMKERWQMLGIILNLVVSKRMRMFSLPRYAAVTETPQYLRQILSMSELGQMDNGLTQALIEQQCLDPNLEAVSETKGKIIFGHSHSVTPCFYLSDLIRATTRTLSDPGLRFSQMVGLIGGKGVAFKRLIWDMTRLQDYSPHFPDHPRKGKKQDRGGTGGIKIPALLPDMSAGLRPATAVAGVRPR